MNSPLNPASSSSSPTTLTLSTAFVSGADWPFIWARTWQAFLAASFLVIVPVFAQAPLARSLPWISLFLTAGWVMIGLMLKARMNSPVWGDLILGFSWSWLSGAIYWGWFRWEPLLHLPIESIGVPFAIVGLAIGQGRWGHCFYLGSLFGTAVTDAYFYLTDLIPFWRRVMVADISEAPEILHLALNNLHTVWGVCWAIVLVSLLLAVGLSHLKPQQPHWWAFSGAVLSTLLVDGLFGLAAAVS